MAASGAACRHMRSPATGASTESTTPTGALFGDVNPSYRAVAWIGQLATEGISAGCANGHCCPDTPVTRDRMAVFPVRTFAR